jgi:hypothetical protein
MFTDKPWENLGKPGRVVLTLLPFTPLVKGAKKWNEKRKCREPRLFVGSSGRKSILEKHQARASWVKSNADAVIAFQPSRISAYLKSETIRTS